MGQVKTRLEWNGMELGQAIKKRVDLFGVKIDPLTMVEAVEAVLEWISQKGAGCKFVITPNVDHIVQVQTNEGLQVAYEQASLVVADGRPVVWAAKLLGANIPETVPGSDLVPAIFDYTKQGNKSINVFLLGAMPGVADRAKVLIMQKWPNVNIVGTLSPDFGFDKDDQQSRQICAVVNATNADILVIGLGAPKQELWIASYSQQLNCQAALCVGATIDFLAGEKPRAPVWMRKTGLEWMHRLFSEPKRLAKRYIIDALIFPKIVYKEWIKRIST